MAHYYIVEKGEPPGSGRAANLGAACEAWAKSAQKERTEVIAVSEDGPVIRRFGRYESEAIASDFRNPKFSWLWKSD
jgi:hypothetical protein